MKNIIQAMLVLCLATTSLASIVDEYSFSMKLNVPRVYNNESSLGYRKYQKQTLSGTLVATYSDDGQFESLDIVNLVNNTHKGSNGQRVTYLCYKNDYYCTTRFNYIGDNKKQVFTTASVFFAFESYPSYSLTEVQEDNSLYLYLAGKGKASTKKSLGRLYVPTTASGYVSGTIGCSCTDYGHLSPTRTIGAFGWTDVANDVASAYGTWKMKFKSRSRK